LFADRRAEDEPGVVRGNRQFGGRNETAVQECPRVMQLARIHVRSAAMLR
jgi:hypothetical protein